MTGKRWRQDDKTVSAGNLFPVGFPAASPALEHFGLKISSGGAHISRTMMLAELETVLATVPAGSGVADYRAAILDRNVLSKATDSTRKESLRRLRELYALDETRPIFGLLCASSMKSMPIACPCWPFRWPGREILCSMPAMRW